MKMLAVAAAVAAIAGLAALPAPTASSATCRASELRGSVLDSSGAAGTIALSLTLRNVGPACTLHGYAGLQLRTAAHPLPTRVRHGGLSFLSGPPRLVRLARGGRASILVAYSDVPVGRERRCAAATRLAIRPPGRPGRLTISAAVGACNHGTLRESPVLAGLRHPP
jgi:hypothetical protein